MPRSVLRRPRGQAEKGRPMNAELKPCPFCGAGEATDNNNASFSGVELMVAGADRPYVWCGTCCASTRLAATDAEAIAAWNTRADLVDPLSDPRVIALVEAAREMFAAFYSNGNVTGRHLRTCRAGVNLEAALAAIVEEK